MNGESSSAQWDLLQKRSLALGFVALIVCVGAALIQPQPFFYAYLLGYIFLLGIPVGCLALLMLHHLVGGRWGFMIQRTLEAAIQTLPLIALLFIPLLFGLPDLYPWARPEVVDADPLLQQKAAYLNDSFFIARAVVYFAVWIGLGRLLVHWSLEQDRTADATLTQRLQKLSGPGLVLYGLTVTFSAIDWIMSLEPKWFSTIFGMIFIVSYGLAALAFVVIVANRIKDEAPLARVISADRFHDLGNLLLALVMLWAYMQFSQFLLIWSENLAEEIPWYLHRITGGWEWVALALLIFLFGLPFVLLLSRTTKQSAVMLARVAGGILFMHWLDVLWMVAPSFHPGQFVLHWMDVVVPIGLGAVWLAVFIGYLKARSLLPLHDPRFTELVEQAQEA
ncbi:MAG TPA: hypothetical protein VEG60_18220 [Candidatus Binatia bacterium]|nr:hypothetical protein [Candidatus Binatia bacterium]